MKDNYSNPKRSSFAKMIKALPPILILAFCSCSGKGPATSDSTPSGNFFDQNDAADSKVKTTNQEEQIDLFVTDRLLGGITIDKMYEVDNLKSKFGKYLEKSQEPANIDYEGMKGDHLNKYRYEQFDLVFYVVQNNREIFAYLDVHKGVANPIGEIGTSMAALEAKYGNRLKKWSDTLYTLGLSGRNYLSGVTLIAENGLLKAIEINLGEI